jgi:hypothetical protein
MTILESHDHIGGHCQNHCPDRSYILMWTTYVSVTMGRAIFERTKKLDVTIAGCFCCFFSLAKKFIPIFVSVVRPFFVVVLLVVVVACYR